MLSTSAEPAVCSGGCWRTWFTHATALLTFAVASAPRFAVVGVLGGHGRAVHALAAEDVAGPERQEELSGSVEGDVARHLLERREVVTRMARVGAGAGHVEHEARALE